MGDEECKKFLRPIKIKPRKCRFFFFSYDMNSKGKYVLDTTYGCQIPSKMLINVGFQKEFFFILSIFMGFKVVISYGDVFSSKLGSIPKNRLTKPFIFTNMYNDANLFSKLFEIERNFRFFLLLFLFS